MEILDGGLATYLVKNGHESINKDPLWSATLLQSNRESIYDAHKEFCDNGASIVITASYQASLEGFKKHLHLDTDQALNLMGKSVQIAKRAVTDSHQAAKDFHTECSNYCPSKERMSLVAGSAGPYGACLHDGSEYTGSYINSVSAEELKDWHRPRLAALTQNDCDLIAIETIPSVKEAEAVLQTLREFPNANAWVSFSCQDGNAYKEPQKRDSTKTAFGESWADSIFSLQEKYCRDQLIGVGINCTAPSSIRPLLDSFEKHPKRKQFPPEMALVIYPNSGESWNPDKGYFFGDNFKPFSEYCEEWLSLRELRHCKLWLGGCCQVFPSDIKKLHECVYGSEKMV